MYVGVARSEGEWLRIVCFWCFAQIALGLMRDCMQIEASLAQVRLHCVHSHHPRVSSLELTRFVQILHTHTPDYQKLFEYGQPFHIVPLIVGFCSAFLGAIAKWSILSHS
jgi:hypothetical protein